MLFSIPSPTRYLNAANLTINTLLFLFYLDYVLYPVIDDASGVIYTRVGAVYPDAAKVVVRYPVTNASDNQVLLLWRQASVSSDSAWNTGPLVNLTAERDWIATTRLDGLWPNTHYECVFGRLCS